MTQHSPELTVVDLANELRRLAYNVARDARKKSDLTCLSNLTAMQPLQNLLMQVLTSEINVVSTPDDTPKPPFGFSK